jgi:TfoX/Sxy family transcriptional regulator of competence genes
MAHDEALADRIRRVVEAREGVIEKKMFGGIAFMLDGKMFCGTARGELMLRIGPQAYEPALSKPHVRPMDFTGRPMNGYVFVGPEAIKSDRELAAWIDQATTFVATIEATAKRKKRTAASKR